MNTRVGKSRAIIPNRTSKRHTYKNINCVLWVWLSELAKKIYRDGTRTQNRMSTNK